MITTVVFDLDGVLRHFADYGPAEAAHGLPSGALVDAAFDAALLDDAVCGRVTYDEWIRRIGDLLVQRHGETARGSAGAFASTRSWIDPDVLAIVRAVRRHHTVAILTNGTTRVEDECERLGVLAEVDGLFNSARIGVAKPDPAVFRHVLDALGARPTETVFIDDSEHKLVGAVEVGMRAIHFRDVEQLQRELHAAGVDGV